MPERFVWISWAGMFLLGWWIIYLAAPRLRTALRRLGCCTAVFGFTEPLFIDRYWHPPSVVGLARTIHADLESFIFCFSIGGTAAVLYNFIMVTPIQVPLKTERDTRREFWQALLFLFPIACYFPLFLLTERPLWSGVIVMLIGTLVRIFRFRELRTKILIGGGMFGLYYLLGLLLLGLLSPGYIARVWSHDIPGGFVGGLPVPDIFFGFTFGSFWSGIYEDYQWTFGRVPIASPSR
jgi:hypothetical protein